jgi:superfamily II DNA or RNA helicase
VEQADLKVVSPDAARSSIAVAFEASAGAQRLGTIELQQHQLDAVGLVRQSIAEFGGAMLCDPVGTGKTFVALAVARSYEDVVVAAPAALKSMWLEAARRAHISVSFVSHEGLSRDAGTDHAPGLVIVDEAHHLRNRSTRRFHALSRLARSAPMLLLTATPVHNRQRDLVSGISLFAGERAHFLSDSEIARVIIGRQQISRTAIPHVAPIEWFHTTRDDTVVNELLSLPPPAPLRDGGVGANLIVRSLIRQWASSDAALRAGLRRRMQRAAALISALESGTYPSASDLAAWTVGDDAIQLAFAELLAPASQDCVALLATVRAHLEAIERVHALVRAPTLRDAQRTAIVRAIRAHHAGTPIVAFSQYEETVTELYRALVRDGEVAALSGHGGKVAGGAIPRDEVIARFAPYASRSRAASRANVVSLLITTDLLSEGFNLQDAGVVIHLDLPWTPARVQQRVGRVARIGSPHQCVRSYAFHPPVSAEAVVRIEAILDTKLTHVHASQSVPRSSELLRATLETWTTGSGAERVASAVRSSCAGFLAAVRSGTRTALITAIDGSIRDDPESLLRAVALAGGEPAAVDVTVLEESVAAIANHLDASVALEGTPEVASRGGRSILLRRIAKIVRRAKPHDRARMASLASAARQVVTRPSGAFVERQLEDAGHLSLPDDEWLTALAASGESSEPARASRDWKIVSIILFAGRDQANALSGATER